MQLNELEISNYKCLDNYGMPIRFDNLNVFIGENDSGKTSMIEILQILFEVKKVEKSMFFDLNKDIKIKAKFIKNGKWIFDSAMTIAEIDFDSSDYYSNIIKMKENNYENVDFYNSYLGMRKNNLLNYIDYLKNYSFYEDLKNFFLKYKDRYLVTIEKIINSNISFIENFAYFDFDKEIKEYANKLLLNEDFIFFMTSSIESLDNYFWRFNRDMFTEKELKREDEWGIPKSLQSFNQDVYSDKCRYCSIFFSSDNEEMKLAKTANLISVFINRNNCENSPWDVGAYLNIDYVIIENKEKNIENSGYYFKDNQSKNILRHSIGNIKGKEIIGTLPLPKFYFFNSDLKDDLITKTIFRDLFQDFFSREVFGYKFHEFLENSIKNYIKKKLNKKSSQVSLNEIKKQVLDYMQLLNENVSDLKFDFTLNNLGEIDKVFEEGLDLILDEKNRHVNISQKGQGFLRKLLITNFLILTQKPTTIELMVRFMELITEDSEAGAKNEDFIEKVNNNRILLIEEPELHLHSNAQRKIMSVLKENLSKNNNQVFITTHSHFIIEKTDFKNIYVFTKDTEIGISNIDNILQLGGETRTFNKLEKSLGVKTTDLLFLKKLIIITEGPHDEAFIRGICRNPQVNLNTEGLLFVPAKGQDNVNYFIGLGSFLKIKVLIILDNNKDNRGMRKELIFPDDEQKKRRNKEISNSIHAVYVLREPDILNYLEAETVERRYGLDAGFLKKINRNDLFKYIKKIFDERKDLDKKNEIENFASQIKNIDIDISKKIIDPIKQFQIF